MGVNILTHKDLSSRCGRGTFPGVRVVVDYRPALRARTGIGEYVHEVARALAATSGPSRALTLFSSSWADRVAAGVPAEIPGAEIVDRRVPVRALTWAWHRLGWPPIERLAGPCDVVHSPTPLLVPASRAAQVVTVFDLHFRAHPDQVDGAVRRDFSALARGHVARADHVIAGSAHAAALVARELGVPPHKITSTPLGPPAWAAEVRAARRPAPDGVFLFIGTLEPRKNVGMLLDAYARLRARRPDAPALVVAGRVTGAARDWLALAATPALAHHVTIAGYVSDSERRALYARARAVVVPSLDEGFGLPALEAMACGVPVVVSPVGALPEVVGDAGLYAAPDAPAAWAEALEACLDDTRAAGMTARGLVRAEHFSWTRAAEATWGAYEAARRARKERR